MKNQNIPQVLKSVLLPKAPASIFLLLLLLILLAGCSTSKNTFVNRTYHTVTTRYNGYYNARESFREGIKRLVSQHVDNYEEVLDVFRYAGPQQAASVKSYMEVAFQKASIAIGRHSMNIRGVEYNSYIEKCYFLIGQSQFFQGEYNLAILTFEYIVRQYDSPLAYEAKVWIAKSQMFQQRYDHARQMLELVTRDIEQGKASGEAIRMYNLVWADLAMRQDNPKEAIPFVNAAISNTRKGYERTRLTFILAQLYHHTGDYASAQKTYARVLKMNPDFDVAFQARIRMAMAFDPKSGNSGDIRSELRKMLRDDKNRAYHDQIYYALAQLELRLGQQEQAVDLLLESIQVADANRLQKGLSFYSLAQIYYQRPDYLRASVYYDSTITFLPRSFKGYETISQKRAMLAELARNLRVIEREDSLQRLASMTPEQRNAVVDAIISKLRQQEQAQLEQQTANLRSGQPLVQRQAGRQQDAGWYFYNPSSIAFGRTEFASRFGNRPLEDLWRISNKQMLTPEGLAAEKEDGQQNNRADRSQFDRSIYLGNIPVTPELIQESNRRISWAYYNLGLVFRDRFQDNLNAAANLERLITRFPDFENKLQAYFLLFSIYQETGDQSRAEGYRGRILDEFPGSDLARILGDPNFLENENRRRQLAQRIYESSFTAFSQGLYQAVLDNQSRVDTLELNPELKGQFAYLKALTLARMGNQSQFREQLQEVVELYAGTSVFQPASDLLASLGSSSSPLIPEAEEKVMPVAREMDMASSRFSFKADAVHFFIMVVDVNAVDARELRRFINNFNRENYTGMDFSMSNVFLDDSRQLITLTNFSNMNLGMEYYGKIMASEGLRQFRADAMKGFLISVENYPVLYQEKNIQEYESFFQSRYLRN